MKLKNHLKDLEIAVMTIYSCSNHTLDWNMDFFMR